MIEILVGVEITPLVIEQRSQPSYEIMTISAEEENELPWYLDV